MEKKKDPAVLAIMLEMLMTGEADVDPELVPALKNMIMKDLLLALRETRVETANAPG